MKIPSVILCLIFLSCGNPKTEIPQDILSENSFIVLLKDIHLAEAKFELHKTKGMENAKNELAFCHTTFQLSVISCHFHFTFFEFASLIQP